MSDLEPKAVELLPCPHEHDQRVLGLSVVPIAWGNAPRWFVRCLDCGATGPRAGTREDATAAWNRRAPTPSAEDKDWVLVPREPTEAMTRAGVDKALSVSLSGGYRWPDYIADLYRALLAAVPNKPAEMGEVKAPKAVVQETSPTFRASIPAWAKWCQPGDVQDKRRYLVRFEDPDCRDRVFTDGAEARAFYERATVSWNCWLFAAEPAHPPQPSYSEGVEALKNVVAAWEATKSGNTTPGEIQRWLIEDMKPAIDNARDAIRSLAAKGGK